MDEDAVTENDIVFHRSLIFNRSICTYTWIFSGQNCSPTDFTGKLSFLQMG